METLQKKKSHMEGLLALGLSIAAARDKLQLGTILREQVIKFLNVDDIVITLYMRGRVYIHASEKAGALSPDLRAAIEATSPFGEEVCFRRPGMPEFLGVGMRNGDELLGAVFLFSAKRKVGVGEDMGLVKPVVDQLACAIINILANEETLARENEKSILLGLCNDIAAVRNKRDLPGIITEKLKKVLPISHVLTGVISEDGKTYSAFLLDGNSAAGSHPDYALVTAEKFPVEDGIMNYVLPSEQPVVFDLTEIMRRPRVPAYLRMNYDCGMREAVFTVLSDGVRKTGVFVIFSAVRNRLNSHHLSLIKSITSQLSTAIATIIAHEKIEKQFGEISNYKQQLEVEKMYLQEEIQTTHNYGEIVGTSAVMRKVFQMVAKVARTQSSVLLMGETGTGKELIARALHHASGRRDRLMVKVNCAALPANLIESELFGHERGSFTGATDRRIGKFELANNSTLFLDEVGELPLDLQSKLLRALQEKEIERLGGKSVIKTDVRIIAATNRDLQKEVQQGNFRSDLFYRLNVFPIVMPPLRQRKEDIPILATHFLSKHAKKDTGGMNFASRVMKELVSYSWPGNVRELEHLIERSILLNSGTTIRQIYLPVTDREVMKNLMPDSHVKTIDEVEREHIIAVLKLCNGKVSGIGGAAEKLRIPSTTLTSKIRRLKIQKGCPDE